MSSFKRRVPSASSSSPSTSAQQISGTRVSPYNGSLLLSTGIASLDDIQGGGLPAGSLLLLEEDRDTSYAKLVLKYWIAQGLCCREQNVLIVSSSLDQGPREIIEKLPYADDVPDQKSQKRDTSSHTDDEDEQLAEGAKENMKIAFRYEGLKKFETSVKNQSSPSTESVYCSTFDLTKTMTLGETYRKRLHLVDVEDVRDTGSTYDGILQQISSRLKQHAGSSQAVRIAIQSIATPAWGPLDMAVGEPITQERATRADLQFRKAVFRFLMALKVLLREQGVMAAAVVTIPAYIIRAINGGASLLRRLEWACDSVIELESFAGSPSLSAAFPAYSGLLHVHRLPTPNSLLPPSAKLSVLRGLAPGSNSTSSGAGGMDNNLGFKLKRRRGLVVETLHLDEGGGTSERRTTPAPQIDVSAEAPLKTAAQINDSIPERTESLEAPSSKPAKKKFERRRIRFDDDPNENPSGILASKSSEPVHGSGLQRDKPQLYEF